MYFFKLFIIFLLIFICAISIYAQDQIKEHKMYNYSIVKPDIEHLEEICQDVKYQYENKISDLVLFEVTLFPEGNPTIDKASKFCEEYDLFKNRLAEMGLTCGVLVQATIGHGYVPDEMHPFQRVINFNGGYEEPICCPYDKNFRKHMSNSLETIAKHCQTVIMIDDDFRLLYRGGRGCGCPLHMAEFNKRAGTNFSREELFEICSNPNTPQKKIYKNIFLATQKDSLIECAKEYRAGIDRVNPNIQGCFCTAGNDPAGEIAKILAGKNNPSILRINNGNYTPQGARNFARNMFRAAQQMAFDYNKADIYLAETDTCPQLRYSTGAMSLHSHFTGTILEGVNGAKHWITKTDNYEPESGVAYRKVLGQNAEFYNYLSKIVPKLKWRGCRIPLSRDYEFDFKNFSWSGCDNGWVTCVLERLGLPMYFSPYGKTAFLDFEPGTDYAYPLNENLDLTNNEIKEMLSGWTFISAECAYKLNKRGFEDCTGVQVEEYDGPHLTKEHIFLDNKNIGVQCGTKKITPINDNVEILSEVYHLERGTNKIPMFPGMTKYKNPLGGTTIVFCGSPTAPFTYSTAFTYLSRSRKLQLIELLKEAGELPVYYPDDSEVYLKAADMEDGSLFVAVFNISLDPIENLPLIFDREITSLEMLTQNGQRVPVKWSNENGVIKVNKTVYTLQPLILFAK